MRRPLKPVNWPILFASLAIAACIVGIFWALDLAVTGDEAQKLPPAVEEIAPVKGATQVPSQSGVFVDLATGYEGVLVIDGLELETVNRNEYKGEDGQQVSLPAVTIYEPGNATLTFVPSPNAAITELTQGRHVVQVIYWKTLDGRSTARSYTWSFEVF